MTQTASAHLQVDEDDGFDLAREIDGDPLPSGGVLLLEGHLVFQGGGAAEPAGGAGGPHVPGTRARPRTPLCHMPVLPLCLI